MDYDKRYQPKGREDVEKKRPESRPFNADRDQVHPEEWRPSDAPKSPTRVGSGSSPHADPERRS